MMSCLVQPNFQPCAVSPPPDLDCRWEALPASNGDGKPTYPVALCADPPDLYNDPESPRRQAVDEPHRYVRGPGTTGALDPPRTAAGGHDCDGWNASPRTTLSDGLAP